MRTEHVPACYGKLLIRAGAPKSTNYRLQMSDKVPTVRRHRRWWGLQNATDRELK